MDLKQILADHVLWVLNNGGSCADLQGANLRGANLQGRDLRRANLRGADLQGANLRRANLQGANLRYADLQYADLQGANLRGADLRRANLDYSCWPLWCGSLDVKIDERIAAQLAYHLLSMWPAARSRSMLALSDKFHRPECPRLKAVDE